MRRRAPLLFQQYLGAGYQPAAGAAAGEGAGGRLSDLLLRQHDEALTRERLQSEQDREAEVEQETESESDLSEEAGEAEASEGSEAEERRGAGAGDEDGARRRGGQGDVAGRAGANRAAAAQHARPHGQVAGAGAGAAPDVAPAAPGAARGGASPEGATGGGASHDGATGGGGARELAASTSAAGVTPSGDARGSGGGGPGEEPRHAGRGPGGAAAADREDFLELMRARFLSGLETDVDYGAIDGDAGLDEDLHGLADQDAQDKYFDSE